MRFISDKAIYSENYIEADYQYSKTVLAQDEDKKGQKFYKIKPVSVNMKFKTSTKVPKTGVMLVGWGGNNGTTLTAVIMANKHKINWQTKFGERKPNYYGSLVKSSTMCMGTVKEEDSDLAKKVCAPMCDLLPFLNPDDIEIDGWDISDLSIGDSMRRAEVLDFDLQQRLYPLMSGCNPRPSVFDPDFVASNQSERANNIIPGDLKKQLEVLRDDIRDFKKKKHLDKVIVLWTASTERYTEITATHATSEGILSAIESNKREEIAPSALFAIASILEGCAFINGSPQNTLYEGIIELAKKHKVFLAGDDFKTGQTKLKSCLVDFLLGSGIKPVSVVSYNHLGNNDGKNLDSYKQFRSKEISKSTLIDEMIESNSVLYSPGEKPDHCVVIKYVPYVGDSKRAMDEYTSEICMKGVSTIAIHNTCEDSLLAVTVMIDLILLCEFFQRVTVKIDHSDSNSSGISTVMSVLGFLLKAPHTTSGEPQVNSFYAQKACIENIVRACLGIPVENHMYLEHKFNLKL